MESAIALEAETSGLAERQQRLQQIDRTGIMATPANSRYNELVLEAGRLSILSGGREALIEYGDRPGTRLRE